MTGIEAVALPFLLTAIAFAPITAFVARSRERQVLIWFFLGALLGPIALALVVFAPPGRCESCGMVVEGWPSHCEVCGALLPTPLQRRDRSAYPTPLGTPGVGPNPVVPAVLPSIVRPFPASPDDEDERPAAAVTRARPSRAKASPKVPVDPGTAVASRVGAARPENGTGPRGQSRSGAHRSKETAILATAVFLTGSSACRPGMHYALAIRGDSLLVLGPLEVDPDVIAVERPLASIAVTAYEDQLLVNDRRVGILTWSLAFRHLSGQSASTVERALLHAGSAKGWSG
jgi:hypothetical protein